MRGEPGPVGVTKSKTLTARGPRVHDVTESTARRDLRISDDRESVLLSKVSDVLADGRAKGDARRADPDGIRSPFVAAPQYMAVGVFEGHAGIGEGGCSFARTGFLQDSIPVAVDPAPDDAPAEGHDLEGLTIGIHAVEIAGAGLARVHLAVAQRGVAAVVASACGQSQQENQDDAQ
jgi:hypothetical protein